MAAINIWLDLARSQFEASNLDDALGSIERASMLENSSIIWELKEKILAAKVAKPYVELLESGFQKAQQGDLRGVIHDLNKAIEINHDKYEDLYKYGNSLVELKRYEEAIIFFDKAIAINPDCYWAWDSRGNALRE